MYEILTNNPVIAILFIAIVLMAIVICTVKAVQGIGLGKIRIYAYQWFEEAEYSFLYGENTQKFEFVVQLARSALPVPFDKLVTEKLLRKAVQLWFDLCKDKLDDGKINGSVKEEK